MSNTHGLTGAPLKQPYPPPLRKFAVFDKNDPCTEHSTGYTGSVALTGDYACCLCGTVWDEQGNVLPPRVEQLGDGAWVHVGNPAIGGHDDEHIRPEELE